MTSRMSSTLREFLASSHSRKPSRKIWPRCLPSLTARAYLTIALLRLLIILSVMLQFCFILQINLSPDRPVIRNAQTMRNAEAFDSSAASKNPDRVQSYRTGAPRSIVHVKGCVVVSELKKLSHGEAKAIRERTQVP